MLSVEAARHAHAVRALLRSGRLALIQIPAAGASPTLESVVEAALAELDALDRSDSPADVVDAAIWRVAGHTLEHLHRLAVVLQQASQTTV